MVLQRIQSLNKLDVELYEYAQGIFAKQHKQAAEKLFDANTRKHLHLFGWHQALGCLFVDHAICLAVHLLVCKCKAKNIETEDMSVTGYSVLMIGAGCFFENKHCTKLADESE
ncbi:hypothetical protein Gotri_024516, partial [Gossypium trilobum]|nr:hypothetical protein [Gossypium trilobum]